MPHHETGSRRRYARSGSRFGWAAPVCLIAIACNSDSGLTGISETFGDIRVTLAPVSRAGEIVINLEVRNIGSTAHNVQFGADCNPAVLVHELSSPDEEVVWDERDWREENGGCLPAVRNADLFAGGAVGVTYRLDHAVILGDSLAAGSYRIVVAFTMNQPATSFNLNAGTVTLER